MEGVEFILAKRISSPKIFYTICLANEGNFPTTLSIMFVIYKVSMKWCLFDSIPLNEIPMSWLVIVASRSKTFSTTCVLFWTCFAWKKIPGPILESKGMHAMFQKKAKKKGQKGNIFENLGQNMQNLKIFWKRAGDCMQLSHVINC